MRFVFDQQFVGVAFKADGFSGNMGAVGNALPDGVLAGCSFDAQGRFFSLWLYDDEGRTYTKRYPFADVPIENDGPDHIARIDVTGSPAVFGHKTGGVVVIKALYAQYFDGPKPEQLFRWNSGWSLVP